MRKTTCRLCDSTSLYRIVDFPDLPLVDSYSVQPNEEPLYPCGLTQCASCGHIQLSEVVDPALLFRDGYLFRTADYPWLLKHFEHYAESVYNEFKPARVLEIGSNDGTLSRMFEIRDCEVLGVDPSDVPSCVPKLKEFFTTQTPIANPADLILANHVFAHVDDLSEIVRGVKKFLAPDGIFVFEAGYALDLLEKHLFDTVYHEHLDYHSVGPLQAFFARHGLTLFRVERNEAKAGSLRGFVCHKGARDSELSLPLSLSLEKAVGLANPRRWRMWAERLEERRFAVMRALGGAPFIGYGAAAGGIATLHHLGLADRCKWLVDDSPRRYGMYAPHANLVVRDPSTLYGYETHHGFIKIVVLAWRYAEQIKAKHPNLEFIVP